jgi:hypothetical protein
MASTRRSDMSESPSPQKRRRVINQLDSPPPREKTAEDYIERLAWSTRVNKKFNQVQFDSKFMIKVRELGIMCEIFICKFDKI